MAAAKTILQLDPSTNILLFESASTIGGVWSKERLYPTLKSNNVLGTYEYSDFPMDGNTYGVEPGQHIPGAVVHKYLLNYAEHFGIFNRIHFDTKVEAAEHQDSGGWLLTVTKDFNSTGDSRSIAKYFTSKLIVAAGLTSDPFIPSIPGSDSFGAPLFHPKDFLKYASTLEADGPVCVFGGTKSAWDVVYAHASKGRRVEWVIRKSGHGPVWMSPAYVTPLKKLLEKLVLTRFMTWFSPCIWSFSDGYPRIRTFLHKTRLGRYIVDKFWGVLTDDLVTLNKFSSNQEVAKLKPWYSPFFIGAGLSILNYPTDIFEYVRNGTVRVHIADIESLAPKTVNLSSGESLEAEAFVRCTGWKSSPPLKFSPSEAELGLPYRANAPRRVDLIKQADSEILSQFPRLRDQPVQNLSFKPLPEAVSDSKSSEEELQPFRLYRFMVPPTLINCHDIAFSGSMMSISTAICTETQALWIAAYFKKQVSLASDAEYEAVLHSRFARWRIPCGFGARFPDMAFDSLPYYDMLLSDLGLQPHRKKGVFENVFSPYGSMDYTGLVDEWSRSKSQ